MAGSYSTEDEQLDALKKWWQENGKSTVLTILLVLAGVFGWQGWQKQKSAEIEAASIMYQSLITAASANNGQPSQAQQATAEHLAASLKAEFPDSSYANYAALFKAQFAVNSNNLPLAVEELQWLLARDLDSELYLQATLRLAKVYAAQSQYEQALELLAIDAGAYAPAYQELTGDIYKSQGALEQALLAYQKSRELAEQAERPLANGVLALKIQHLTNQLALASQGS